MGTISRALLTSSARVGMCVIVIMFSLSDSHVSLLSSQERLKKGHQQQTYGKALTFFPEIIKTFPSLPSGLLANSTTALAASSVVCSDPMPSMKSLGETPA